MLLLLPLLQHAPILGSSVQETQETVQVAAASLLGRLQVQPLHGPRVTLALQRLLPPGLVAAIQASPVAILMVLLLSSDKPGKESVQVSLCRYLSAGMCKACCIKRVVQSPIAAESLLPQVHISKDGQSVQLHFYKHLDLCTACMVPHYGQKSNPERTPLVQSCMTFYLAEEGPGAAAVQAVGTAVKSPELRCSKF